MNMKSKSLVVVSELSEGSTTVRVGTVGACLNIGKTEAEQGIYREAARKILDTASKTYNRVGIDALMAALIYETLGEGYAGKHNR